MTSTSEIVSAIVEIRRRHQQEIINTLEERFPDTKWSDRIRAFSIADKIAGLDDDDRSDDPDIVAWRQWEARPLLY
jgi:hypothetical protein